eukprot:309246_1
MWMQPEVILFVLGISCFIGVHNTFENAPTVDDIVSFFQWYTPKFAFAVAPLLFIEEVDIYWNVKRDIGKVLSNALVPLIIQLLCWYFYSLNIIFAMSFAIAWNIVGLISLPNEIKQHISYLVLEMNVAYWILTDKDITIAAVWVCINEPVLYQEIINYKGKFNFTIIRLFISSFVCKLFAINQASLSMFSIILYFIGPLIIAFITYKVYGKKESAYVTVLLANIAFWYGIVITW